MDDQQYLVTARKYRPSLFKEVVAQEHVTDTLKNALRLERLAHAYLFCGPRGVGKTTGARILAKAINCETPRAEREDGAEPCCDCESCRMFEEGGSLNVFEFDAASNRKIADVEPLLEKVNIPPQGGRKKVYIIDEVHMFSKTAFNALLKTLEEPPDHALFIFATTEPNKVIPTVRSRCQRFDFRRIPVPDIVDHLHTICAAEGIEADEESLMLLARKGNGALRDALSAFDQALSLCGTALEYGALTQALGVVEQDLFFRLTDHVADQNTAGMLTLVRHVVRSGYDLQEVAVGLAEHLRNLLVAHSLGGDALEEVAAATRTRYAETAERFAEADLLRLLTMASDAEENIKRSSQPRLKLETVLLQMAQLRRAADLQAVLEQIDRLEQMAEDGALPDSLPSRSPSGSSPPSEPQSASPVEAAPSEPSLDASSPSVGPSGVASSEQEDAPPETKDASGAARTPSTDEPQPADVQPADAQPADTQPADSKQEHSPADDENDPPPRPDDDSAPTPPDPDPASDSDPDPAVAYGDLFGPPALSDDTDNEAAPGTDAVDDSETPPDAADDASQAVVSEPGAPDSAKGLATHWPRLVTAIKAEFVSAGALLEETEPVEYIDETLTVAVPRSLHRDTLSERRSALLRHLNDLSDRPISNVRFVVDTASSTTETDNATLDASLSPREALQQLRNTYPALDVLFAEFEAEPVW